MRSPVALVLLLSVVLSPSAAGRGGGKSRPPKLPPPSPEGIVDGELGERLDSWMTDPERWTPPFTGCVLVARKGRIVLEKGYGAADVDGPRPMPPDAIFDWCSVSKQFTAAAVLRLEMEKRLKIDDPISRHLDDVPREKRGITLRHLLGHTSGLGHSDRIRDVDFSNRDAVVRCVLEHFPMAAEPGERFEYSNLGYVLLAAIVELEAKMPFERYLDERLFEPAGMIDSGSIGDPDLDLDRVPREDAGSGERFAYGPRLTWGYRGCGGVVAPARDLLRWDEALRGGSILSKKAQASYTTPGLDDYALGMYVDRAPGTLRYHHSGHTGHLVTWYERRPEQHVVIAIASAGEPAVHPDRVARELAALLQRD